MTNGIPFTRVVRLAAVTLAAAVAATTFAACGSSGKDTDQQRLQQEEIARAKADARREAETELKADQAAKDAAKLRKELDKLKAKGEKHSAESRTGGGSGSSANVTPASSGGSCGGGVSVNTVTSCPFASNVVSEYYASGGDTYISVFSPVTGRSYEMTCSQGSPHVCTGGSNARVTFP